MVELLFDLQTTLPPHKKMHRNFFAFSLEDAVLSAEIDFSVSGSGLLPKIEVSVQQDYREAIEVAVSTHETLEIRKGPVAIRHFNGW
jgi:hypothetical protein